MNLVGWKQLPKANRRDIIVSVVRLSLFFFTFRLLLVGITSGWSTIIDKWYVELGWLLVIVACMTLTIVVGRMVQRHSEKKQSSDGD